MVPISRKSSIKFVKNGAKVPRKWSPLVGILRHAWDWVLLADLNCNYSLPVHITFTQLRPDITIFSNNLRKVFLIELTRPWEESIECWHSTKMNKYLAPQKIIEYNGWCVERFAEDVGVRGYCSKSGLCCFKKLFRNTVTMIKQIFDGMLVLYLAGQKQ